MRIGFRLIWLALTIALPIPNLAFAQEPHSIKRIVLPTLDSQMRARIVALDRRLNPVQAPEGVAALIGQLTAPSQCLGGFAAIVGDSRNNEIWEQLADEYYRMALESGGTLIAHSEVGPAKGVAWTCSQLRRLAHHRLTLLPRATLEQYRQRVDREAKSLLAEGKRTRSPIPLRRLVDDLFCSSAGDQALDLLGDLAFERGDFDEASHWWRLLAPIVDAKDDALRFPDPQVDLARVHAKQALAQLFQGRLNEGREAIADYQRNFPNAKGELAGRTGRYAEILRDVLSDFAQERVSNNDEPWPTFGGANTRNRVLSQAPSWHLFEDGPAWRVKLPSLTKAGRESPVERGSLTRNVAFHPIIVQQQVLIADHRSVMSYHLTTGRELFRYDLKEAGLSDPGPGLDANVAMPRFTLSADDRRAYARLGQYSVGAANGKSASYLVCLDLTEPAAARKRELWHVPAPSDGVVTGFFEGTPLVHGGLVYIALTKIVDQHTLTSIVCYDTRGKQRWSREVCESSEFERSTDGPRHRQHLLTWADGQIVYCTHAGAIVAVDAWTGQPTWGVRYPSRGPRTIELEPSPRDLTPALGADGAVIVAPLDSERIFCIDARTGRVRWESDHGEIVHLLGSAHGRLFGSTRTGIVALDMATGQVEWTQPLTGRLPSLGRGLLAGGWLFWPTEDVDLPYRAVTLRDGTLRAEPKGSVLPEPPYYELSMMHTLPAGNLAFGHGCLAIAGTNELVVYVPIHKQPMLDQRPQARMEALYHAARRHASAGQTKEAAQSYRALLDVTKMSPHAKTWRALIDGRLRLLDEREGEAPAEPRTPAKPVRQEPRLGASNATMPLVRAWEQEDGRVWAVDDAHDDFFCIQSNTVTCRALADGAQRWRKPLAFEPTWFGRWQDCVVIVGADSAQMLRVQDGSTVWTFAAPSRKVRVGNVIEGVPKLINIAKGFVQAERWDDSVLLLDDYRHFYRLRLDTGAVAWHDALPSADLRPLDGGAFTPFYTRIGTQLLTQTVSGQAVWLGDERTLMGAPSRPWLQSPPVVDQRLIVTRHPGRIDGHALKPPHAKLWSYQAPWTTSLSGEICRLIHHDPVLIAVVPRNDGPELIRLNPEKGQLLWALAPRQFQHLDIESICIGDTSFYYTDAGKLYARSLNDGALQWTLSLSPASERWRIRYTKHALAVYPVKANAFAIDFVDPWQGEPLQRLTFPDASNGEVTWTPRTLIVSAGARIYGFQRLGEE
jgi:outer membrane protein assembly factor BamB